MRPERYGDAKVQRSWRARAHAETFSWTNAARQFADHLLPFTPARA